MRRLTALAAVSLLSAVLRLHATPSGTSYTGVFNQDNDRRVFYVTLSTPRIFRARTYSYAGGATSHGASVPAGGFDTTLSLFTAAGDLVAQNEDGGCGNAGSDPVTSMCWDAYLFANLPAGNYILVLTQSDNSANGPTLADGFVYDGGSSAQTQFTPAAITSSPLFWDDSENKRSNAWTLELFGASASEVTTISSSSTLPAGIAGQSYSPFTFTAQSGASATLSWSVVSGSLPAGISLDPTTGVLSGLSTVTGNYTFTIQVTDGIQPVTKSFSLAINPPAPAILPLQITSSGSLGEFVSAANVAGKLGATGGKPPYTWSAASLPPGFNLNPATGDFSGAASAPGGYTFTAAVQDAETPSVTKSIAVSFQVFGIVIGSVPQATAGKAYSQSLSAAGGTPPYVFSASGLPAGFSLSPSGMLSGTPKLGGNFGFTVQVADAAGLTSAASFRLVVSGPASPLTISGGVLPGGGAGVPYSATLQASGGAAPYTWTLSGNGLPDGLSLSPAGAIQGTPKKPGTWTFGALATDSIPATAAGSFTITIAPAALTLTSLSSFPVGIAGSDYPVQILTTTGGVAPYTFSISSGSLPDGLAFTSPQFSGIPGSAGLAQFTIKVTDATGQSATGPGSLLIQPAHADLILSQSTIPFSISVGASGAPTPANVTVRSSVIAQQLNYSISVSPAAPWLDVAGGGITPGAIGISVDPSALSLSAAGSPYQTTISVTCLAPSPCAGTSQQIAVSLNIGAPPAQLTFDTNLLSFGATASNPGRSTRTLDLGNSGGGVLTINSITAADKWLSISGSPSAVQAGPAVPLTVSADSTGLSAGYYTSSLVIDTSAGSQSLPVSLLVSPGLTMSVAPQGSTFQIPAGNAPGSGAGAFNVAIAGSGSANWSASVLPGANWLSVSTPSGSASSSAPGTVRFAIDPAAVAALAPGSYYGDIRVTSSEAVDSPLDYSVVLNVTSAAEPVKPVPSTAGMVFITDATSPAPAAQSVQVFASSSAPVAFQASTATANDGSWLTVSPAKGSASSASPASSSISVNTAGLAPGVYRGAVSYAFSAAAVRTVNVTLIIGLSSGVSASSSSTPRAQASGSCVATSLVPTQAGLFDNFQQSMGWPAPLEVLVLDDCGRPVPDAQVSARFSNGDPPLTLTPVDNASGLFSATWTPRTVSPQVTVTTTATSAAFAPAAAQVTGEVLVNPVPILAPNGAFSIFTSSVGAPVAPGSVLQIYGSNLSSQTVAGTTVPLTTTLGGTSVLIGGIPAPLYFVSPGQINAQAPFELSPGGQYQIQVSSDGATGAPESIYMAPVSPALASLPTGAIIAEHADYSLVTADSPAKPGETILIYLSGLGATDNPVGSGAASPFSPLAHALAAPSILLNGQPAPAAFYGLSPGSVGLYQINFQVPQETPAGDLPLVVNQSGASSNTAVLPVSR
ncbi:MAG TPA: DVUA0089 family protein [Bryobacteraceae bacterium]|nr:DVUA0089 family protein [Bryobacteraceae bacterium]